MLSVKQQKYLIYFDHEQKIFASFLFQIKQKQDLNEKKQKNKDPSFGNPGNQTYGNFPNNVTHSDILKLNVAFKITNSFTYKWQSEFYDLKIQQPWGIQPRLHKIPLSLETYFALYKNPQQWKVSFVLKPKFSDPKCEEKQIIGKILKNQSVGKLIITSNFIHAKNHQPFLLPIFICQQKDINLQAKKTIKIITLKDDDSIVCSGKLIEVEYCDKVGNFSIEKSHQLENEQFRLETYQINSRINSEHICVLKHKLQKIEFEFNKIVIKIMSPKQPRFISTLARLFYSIQSMISIEPIIIIQDIETVIQSCHGIVFYTDVISLSQKIFRSYLFDKIQDKWLIEGMVSYSRSNKMFQDCMKELIQLMNEGEELFPLANDEYYFDDVWKAKAKFFFYILANFKAPRDYGSSTLVGLILQFSLKKKINSIYLFRRLKKKYGLQGSFRSIYEQQFIKSTGLNRIFYELIDIRRDNSVKFIIRQKSLLNKYFKTYNLFRIKLEQTYDLSSNLIEKIKKKNRYDQLSNKRKDLIGSLAVPQFIKCRPYFRGKMTLESDACEPFELQLIQQNVIEKTKLSSSLRARPATRKPGEIDKGIDGFTWMMIDTAYVFPAVYKLQNVQQNVILQRIKKIYESEQQQIKVLNCISSTNHSQSPQICKALLQKLKMQPKLINTTISVKRKILQIIPIFINKLKDSTVWEDYYGLFKLYEPPCYDHSEEGYQFLTSLIESSTQLEYKKQFDYYYNQLHRILLAILLNDQRSYSEQKQIKIKNSLFKSLMRWKSKYSFQILKNLNESLIILYLDVSSNITLLKNIIENLIPFLDSIQTNNQSKIQLIDQIRKIIQKCIDKDFTNELYAIYFQHQLIKQQKNLNTIDFLRLAFRKLQQLEGLYISEASSKYWLCLKSFKNVIQQNKIKYGLKIQLDELNEDQNYFLAEYLWCKLCSKSSLIDPRVRLQWVKIYRVFYFYFTPIITLYKLRKNRVLPKQRSQFSLSEVQLEQILVNCAQLSFIPDIRWMSGYDSSSSKQQKAKYQQYNLDNNRRKRKHQQLTFQQNNIITRYIKENPGKDSWEDIFRQALRIIILIQEKKEVDNPEQTDKYKKIVEGLKNVQNFLKRGNMPNGYSMEKVKSQAQYVMRQHHQDTGKFQQIFQMAESAVNSIMEQRRKKQIEKENQMKIVIKDFIIEEEDVNHAKDVNQLHPITEHPLEQQVEVEEKQKVKEEYEKQEQNDVIENLKLGCYDSIFGD